MHVASEWDHLSVPVDLTKVLMVSNTSPCATNLPFICELYTTPNHHGRELDLHVLIDTTLQTLERMRMVDTTYAWAPRTLENAC